MLRTISLLITACLTSFRIIAAPYSELSLSTANDLYQKQDFTAAIVAYEQVLQSGFHSPTLYYNLGNSYFKAGQPGKAILNLERALLLAPNDPDIKHNIKAVNQRLVGSPEPIPGFFLERWWSSWRSGMSVSGWSITALLILWPGVAGLAVWILGSSRRTRMLGFFAGVGLIVFSMLPFSLAVSRASFQNDSGYAVVMDRSIALRAAPDSGSESSQKVYEGHKVYLLDQIGKWRKVRLMDGEVGWLANEALVVIGLSVEQ